MLNLQNRSACLSGWLCLPMHKTRSEFTEPMMAVMMMMCSPEGISLSIFVVVDPYRFQMGGLVSP